MIKQLKNILASDGKEFSALLEILSKQEIVKLENYLQNTTDVKHDLTDVKIKFFALNALFIYIKNNPSIENELLTQEIPTEKLAFIIYELAIVVYESDINWEHYFYVSSYAVLADKQTMLTTESELPDPSDFLDKILRFFINFSLFNVSIKTPADLEKAKNRLSILKREFLDFQKEENIQSQKQLYEIVALSNLVSLGEKLQRYFLYGEGSNIPASINNEVANAINVFAKIGDIRWELICGLLRFVLRKHYDNCIWAIANREPIFKSFVEKRAEQGDFLFSLFPSQKLALKDVLTPRKSIVISMPTSSGKTLLAELKILYTRSQYNNDCLCVYVAPTNALVNQTLKGMKRRLIGLKVERLLAYNHFDRLEQSLIGDKPDVLVSTPEKLNFLLKNEEANILERLRLVVVDEAHNIGDDNRGSIWEFLLASIKQNDERLSYLLLTPFVNNKDELAGWLGNDNRAAIGIEWTPTKQYVAYHSLHNNKEVSKVNYLPSAGNSIIKDAITIDLGINLKNLMKEMGRETINHIVRNAALVAKYAKHNGCILILHRGADSAEKLAIALAKKFDFSSGIGKDKLVYAKEVIGLELGRDHPLVKLLDRGVAFHHAQLSPLVKETIEDLVNDDLIKALVATTTLAQGMNFPIKTVIFETTTLGGGNTTKPLSHNDFWNIAGRAGRAYKDSEGHIVLGCNNSNKNVKKKLESFILHDIENTISSLNAFFNEINDHEVIDYRFITDNPIAQNFLHYLNHLMNIGFKYDLKIVGRQDILNILSNSLYFKQSEFSEGFLESQEKIFKFSKKYIDSIKMKKVSQLKLADTLGITDISLAMLFQVTADKKHSLTKCIDRNDRTNLAVIVDAINKIPELKINLGRNEGAFNAKLIADILLDWINGKSISAISRNNGLTVNECSGYIFSNLKNYIPWGMAIYQSISDDKNPMLPSYAYYGVKDELSVKLAYIGVPRFALSEVKNSVTNASRYEDLSELRKFVKNQNFVLRQDESKNTMVNQIIKNSIL